MPGSRERILPIFTKLGTLSLLFLGLSACAGQQVSQSAYATEFEQARQIVATEFQREILSDDVITDEEFREVRQRYVDCLAEAGIEAVANSDGSYEIRGADTEADEQVEHRCSEETTLHVESLYYASKMNPANENFSVLVADCLRSQGIVDDSFTEKDWDQFVNAFSSVQNSAMNEDGEVPLSKDIPNLPTLPGGIAMDDPRVQQCSNNPLGK